MCFGQATQPRISPVPLFHSGSLAGAELGSGFAMARQKTRARRPAWGNDEGERLEVQNFKFWAQYDSIWVTSAVGSGT